ncbi:site-specific DNA-methyltransferase [Candidatus Heimdallarchaeota archaeon]|nr:MAG: site-specific DNA-methyltransferase [Candidatus Heimdallarchaeota archaeon]
MQKTSHTIHYQNSQDMTNITDESVDLVVTSPPYSMVKIWDDVFTSMNPEIGRALKEEKGDLAFELMHVELDKVWNEAYRVLKTNGIACINIGDATRSIGGDFKLYASHSRIINHCCKVGFQCLPLIVWTKLTNAPNKFMGSGMLPPGGYVTLEHEYILIFRKGGKRVFSTEEEKNGRQNSAYFWEERNKWCSDVWDLKGVHQKLNGDNIRKRSAAFPFELAYRLISMYSLKEDTILDPFLGTGTTMLAAMALERNSVNIEIEKNFKEVIDKRVSGIIELANEYNGNRIQEHIEFMKEYSSKYEAPPYENEIYGFSVKTKQEINFKLRKLIKVHETDFSSYEVYYE